MPKTSKKRRSPRPKWMIALDPIALKKSERAKRARDAQRKRGFEFFVLDDDGSVEVLRARLDWDPYVVTTMCFTRWKNGHHVGFLVRTRNCGARCPSCAALVRKAAMQCAIPTSVGSSRSQGNPAHRPWLVMA